MIADPVAPIFVGREAFLQTVRATVQRDRVVAITGPSGIGKTAVAREYLRRYGAEYQHVLWLNAATRELLLADCIAWSQQLGVPLWHGEGLPLIIQPLRDWLSAQTEYLLIVDGVDDPALIKALFPTQLRGHVLLTMRADIAPFAATTTMQLDPLSARDGAMLLLHHARLAAATAPSDHVGTEHYQAGEAFANEVGGLPLALELAGATITVTQRSIGDYVLAYQRCSLPATAHNRHGKHSQVIAKCHALAVAALEHEQNAITLLRQCAFLVPDVLYELFWQHTFTQPDTTSKHEAHMTALAALLSSRLVVRQSSPHLLRMHPLVKIATQAALALDEQQVAKEQVIRLLHRFLPTHSVQSTATCLRYIAHIQEIERDSDSWTFAFVEAAEVFAWAAQVLVELKDFVAAKPLQQRATAIWEHVFGEAHPTSVLARYNLALLHQQMQDYAQAESQLHHVITARAELVGADHPDTILVLNSLGEMYAEQRKPSEAEAVYRKALSLCEHHLGMEHVLTAAIQHNLASLCFTMGRYDEAAALLQHVCAFREKALGSSALETIKAVHGSADVMMALGRRHDAEQRYHHALQGYAGHEDEYYGDIIGCLHSLMILYQEQGRDEEAVAMLQRLQAFRVTLAQKPVTPSTIVHLAGLAGFYFGMEQFAEAKTLLQQALALCERMPELGPPNIAVILNMLVRIDMLLGQKEAAIENLRHACHVWETMSAIAPSDQAALRADYDMLLASLQAEA